MGERKFSSKLGEIILGELCCLAARCKNTVRSLISWRGRQQKSWQGDVERTLVIAKVPRRPRCRMPGKPRGTEGTCKYPEEGTRRYLDVPRYPGCWRPGVPPGQRGKQGSYLAGDGLLPLGAQLSREVGGDPCCNHHSQHNLAVGRENVTCLRKKTENSV